MQQEQTYEANYNTTILTKNGEKQAQISVGVNICGSKLLKYSWKKYSWIEDETTPTNVI